MFFEVLFQPWSYSVYLCSAGVNRIVLQSASTVLYRSTTSLRTSSWQRRSQRTASCLQQSQI